MLKIEVVVDATNQLGEGPLWCPQASRLYWIDSFGPGVFSCDAQGQDVRHWPLEKHVGALALRADGGGLIALADGFYFLDFDTGETQLVARNDTPGTRLNDGKVDRKGRFIVGSMDVHERDPVGVLYRLDPDLSLHRLDTGIVVSNGPCWSLDNQTLYFADSLKKVIYAYDYDLGQGTVLHRRDFASFADFQGYPDGATVDAEGFVWSVEVYRGRLVRFDPEGHVDRVVGLPTFSATSLTFGGANLDIAYVTSMARPINGLLPQEREAGAVFAIHGLGVRGVPEPRFGG